MRFLYSSLHIRHSGRGSRSSVNPSASLEEEIGKQEADQTQNGDHLHWDTLDGFSHCLGSLSNHRLFLILATGLDSSLSQSCLLKSCDLSLSLGKLGLKLFVRCLCSICGYSSGLGDCARDGGLFLDLLGFSGRFVGRVRRRQ